jgi:hypothetical protein
VKGLEYWAPVFRLWVLIGGGLVLAILFLLFVVTMARAVVAVRGVGKVNREREEERGKGQ